MMGVSFGIALGRRMCQNWMPIQAKVSFQTEIQAKVYKRRAIDTQQLFWFELIDSPSAYF
jgi:hypothetical protein